MFSQENIILTSKDGAVGNWHTDTGGASVCYVVVRGCQVFYLVTPSALNTALFQRYREGDPAGTFFGDHPELDGGCRKVSVLAGQALVVPAGTIYMVSTMGLSVVLAMHFVHVGHLLSAAEAHRRESREVSLTSFYDIFPTLALSYIIRV